MSHASALRWATTGARTLLLLVVGSAVATGQDVFDGFRPGWSEAWSERLLASRPTRYDVVLDGADAVLRATSRDAASALWRRLDFGDASRLTLSWRWRVSQPLTGNHRERTKQGDDYAARVLLTFGQDTFSRRTRALCYVWAETESAGSVFRNPRSDNIATIVLRSGEDPAGAWAEEERDVLADFRAFFGEHPDAVGAIAVIVDTDDTGSSAVAWFDDVELRHEP